MNWSDRYSEFRHFHIPMLWGALGVALLFVSEWVVAHTAISFGVRVGFAVGQLLPMMLCLYTFIRAFLAHDELRRRIIGEAIVIGMVATMFLSFVYAALQRVQVWSPDWRALAAWLPLLCAIAHQFTKRKYA